MAWEERGISYLDVLLALLLFIWPPMTVFLTFCIREVRSLRALRRRDQAEAEALAAEGFPPA